MCGWTGRDGRVRVGLQRAVAVLAQEQACEAAIARQQGFVFSSEPQRGRGVGARAGASLACRSARRGGSEEGREAAVEFSAPRSMLRISFTVAANHSRRSPSPSPLSPWNRTCVRAPPTGAHVVSADVLCLANLAGRVAWALVSTLRSAS